MSVVEGRRVDGRDRSEHAPQPGVALERPDDGTVTLHGQDVSRVRGGDLRRMRRDLQLMFQDPYSSLDPRMRVGAIIREPLSVQHIGSRAEQQERVFELLGEVGLPRNAVASASGSGWPAP